MTRIWRSRYFWNRISEKRRDLKIKLLFQTNRKLHLTYGIVYYVWRPWLTSKLVARVCQHQLSFLFSTNKRDRSSVWRPSWRQLLHTSRHDGSVMCCELSWHECWCTVCLRSRLVSVLAWAILGPGFEPLPAQSSVCRRYVTELEYNSVIWSPHLNCDIEAIERVQRRFTKRLPGYHKHSYSERLPVQLLQLPSLETRRLQNELIWCYKIVFGHTIFFQSVWLTFGIVCHVILLTFLCKVF